MARVPLGADAAPLLVCARLPNWDAWQGEAWVHLDPDETARARRQREAAAGERLALTYALRRAVLGFALGCAPADVPLRRAANGMTSLGEGVWTSLSHSADAMALALSRHGPVGIDLEQRERAPVMAEIAERVASRAELARLSTLPASIRNSQLLELWVRKEALLKCAGVGLAVEMHRFEAPDHEVVAIPDTPPFAARARLVDAGGDYLAALAWTDDRDAPATPVPWLLPGR